MTENDERKSRKIQVRLDAKTDGMLSRIREADPSFCLSTVVRAAVAAKADELGVRKSMQDSPA